jgi:hypothetical protein
MTRTALLLSGLFVAACSVGEVPNGMGGGDGGATPGEGGITANACLDRITPPNPAHSHTAGGTSNAGQNCMLAGCHLPNNGAGPPYQFAGTVHIAGTTNPSAGATIRIKSGSGAPITAITDADGNFSFPAGSISGAFTATTDATACPTVTPMVTQMIGGNGVGAGANSCNSCHAQTGGTTTPITL